VAIALTVCRGRSHDEYYFDRPDAITNEPTPKPYLALGRPEIYTRSLRSETLRLAMRDIAGALQARGVDLDMTANVHGAFGMVADWPVLRSELQPWLAANGEAVTDAAIALADYTPTQPNAREAAQTCRDHLLADIDAAASAASGHDDLSQRLAEHGVLPMYGFPSSVRYLHLSRPQRAYPWPPPGVIDRDLAMAVAQFAPMSEVVKDGEVYPIVGISAFKPQRPRPIPEADPLGPTRHVSICRSCSYLAEGAEPGNPGGVCPRCGAGPDSYRDLPLREPLGFRAGRPSDFDGNFAWTARAMAARAHTDLDKLLAVPTGSAIAYSGPGRRFVINDNGGKLFELRPSTPGGPEWGGYVSTEAIRRDLLPAIAATGDPINVALAAVQATDFLFIGPEQPTRPAEGIRLNLTAGRQPGGARDASEGRRGAWYSLAFLLRTAAASHLDVQPLELTAGIYAGLAGGQPTPFAFIADTLENGAGFSSHLGGALELPALLAKVDTYLEELSQSPHADECVSSCYRCLRDYGNMAYHALLDWRLARDLHRVLRGHALQIDSDAERRALGRWAASYGGQLLEGTPAAAATFEYVGQGSYVVIARHPLEAAEQTLIAPRLSDTAAIVEAQHPDANAVVYVDTFTLDRDPRRVLEMCNEADAASP